MHCLQDGGQLNCILRKICTLTYESSGGEADTCDVLDAVLSQMTDAEVVTWAPDYGAAAVRHETPRPCPLSEIHVLGLDVWEQYQHRYASSVPFNSLQHPRLCSIVLSLTGFQALVKLCRNLLTVLGMTFDGSHLIACQEALFIQFCW
jgi:hypothetical protein